MEKTEIMRRHIHQEAMKALVNSRLPHDHPMREVLEAEAQIVGDPGCVRVVDDNGSWVMLEDRIKELKADPRFRDSVPNPPIVIRGDEEQIRRDFDKIARGEVQVTR